MSENGRQQALERRIGFLEKDARRSAAWRAEHDGRINQLWAGQQERNVKADAATADASADRHNLWVAVGQMKVKIGFVIAISAGVGSAAGALIVAMLSRSM